MGKRENIYLDANCFPIDIAMRKKENIMINNNFIFVKTYMKYYR